MIDTKLITFQMPALSKHNSSTTAVCRHEFNFEDSNHFRREGQAERYLLGRFADTEPAFVRI